MYYVNLGYFIFPYIRRSYTIVIVVQVFSHFSAGMYYGDFVSTFFLPASDLYYWDFGNFFRACGRLYYGNFSTFFFAPAVRHYQKMCRGW